MSTLSTDQKGQIALLKVQLEAGRKGAAVFLPTTPCRCDLILDYEGRLLRVQVKYADGKPTNAEGAIQLDLRKQKKCYTREEIDLLLVYVPQIDKVCWFSPEVFHERSTLYLRLLPSRNGQKYGCRMIEDFVW